MIRYGQERKLDLASFLPGYVQDEELSEVVGVFQDVLNEMYEGAESYTKTQEISISRAEHIAGEDASDVLYKYGNGKLPTAVDAAGNVTSGPEGVWPYESTGSNILPTQDQLTLRDDNGDINPEYVGTLPVGNESFPIKDSLNSNNDNLENYPFDYNEPIDVQAVSETNNSGALSYNKTGMYEDHANAAGQGNKKLVGYSEANSFLSSDLVERTYNESISVLEKIYKLGNLKDPSLIDFEYITYFADHIGYDMQLNMFHFEHNTVTQKKYKDMITEIEAERALDQDTYIPLTSKEKEAIYNMLVNKAAHNPINEMVADEYDLNREILDEVKKQFIEMQVRALIENLPYWYKIKGTDDSLKILLYSFGLIADIHNYYTQDYTPNRQNWEVADVFYNTGKIKTNMNNINALTEDFTEIPDDWYPTPHFQVKFDYNATWANSGKTDVLSDMDKFGSMIEAIHASKPINTVFKGLAGIFRTAQTRRVGVKEVVRATYSSSVFEDSVIYGYVVDDVLNPTKLTKTRIDTEATRFIVQYEAGASAAETAILALQTEITGDANTAHNVAVYYNVTNVPLEPSLPLKTNPEATTDAKVLTDNYEMVEWVNDTNKMVFDGDTVIADENYLVDILGKGSHYNGKEYVLDDITNPSNILPDVIDQTHMIFKVGVNPGAGAIEDTIVTLQLELRATIVAANPNVIYAPEWLPEVYYEPTP
jgi:hypothetical protein